jgi:hypothetical protein
MPEVTNHRVRINAAQDAKGFYKIEATAEFDSVEEAAANVAAALVAGRESITAAGFKVLADPA